MKIIIVQSIPEALELIRTEISRAFPQLKDSVLYESDFEKSLALIPKTEGVTVIASQVFHDRKDQNFSKEEKTGDKLAEEIKKINPAAKVFIFSTLSPLSSFVDGFYQKANSGDNTPKEILQIFIDLELYK